MRGRQRTEAAEGRTVARWIPLPESEERHYLRSAGLATATGFLALLALTELV